MARKYLAVSFFLSVSIAGCGGGSDSAGGTTATATTTATVTYTFVRPKAGVHLVYAQKLLDNLNNTINRTMTQYITSVNADGSFAVHEEDPAHNRVVSGTVDQSLYPTDYQYNAVGQATSWVVTPATGAAVTCTVTQGNPGAPSPLTAGQSWSVNYLETCGTGAGTAFAQSGTFAGLETITVAAGTFSAYKFTSTVTRTVNGTTQTETVSRWADAASADAYTLKSSSAFTYSGTAPASGALVSETSELQSVQ